MKKQYFFIFIFNFIFITVFIYCYNLFVKQTIKNEIMILKSEGRLPQGERGEPGKPGERDPQGAPYINKPKIFSW
ncbi:MAG: hypothetical protein Q8784_00315 [Vigna little leaf phytoplasma]|nr:hypothetical protein [Vigna little leaf phytoplasma]